MYLDPPTETDESVWAVWIPAIVIEVVSPGSTTRDYDEKPEEYLQFGVREYWIVDEPGRQVTILRRSRGRWTKEVVGGGGKHVSRILPGFELDCGRVFAAAARVPE